MVSPLSPSYHRVHAEHLVLAGARCLAVSHRPTGPVRGALLLFPALAEEMNKTRRATTLAAQAMAEQGLAVLQVDWQGSGDSEGDFAEADWAAWLAQATAARAWWAAQHPNHPLLAWGVRAGCLMASALDADAPWDGQLWWQPVAKGQTHWQQWLRLKQAAGLADGGSERIRLEDVAQRGDPLEIAGYTFAPGWVQGLVASELKPPRGPTLWLEASRQTPPALLPASAAGLSRWNAPGLQARAVNDPAPWAVAELEDCPALTQASLDWWNTQWSR